MAVDILIQFNGKELKIPINPEEITIERDTDNDDIDIIGLGQTIRKGDPGLIETSIESFFPAENGYFSAGIKPQDCVDFINEILEADSSNNNVAKIITIGLPKNLNMYFVIESFEYDHKAGEEDDIYYTLDIKQYIPYGATVVSTTSTSSTSRTSSTTSASKTSTSKTTSKQKTYTVKKGDCLWNITKKYTGNGANWKKLYNLNKKVIGSNPNLIYPGQKLTLPSGW